MVKIKPYSESLIFQIFIVQFGQLPFLIYFIICDFF